MILKNFKIENKVSSIEGRHKTSLNSNEIFQKVFQKQSQINYMDCLHHLASIL